MATRYLTDGEHLYEVVGPRAEQNHGLEGGTLAYWLVIDCANDQARPVEALTMSLWETVAETSL